MSSTKMMRVKISVKILFLILLGLLFVYSSFTYIRSIYSFYIAIGGYVSFWFITNLNHQKWPIRSVSLWAILALAVSFLYVLNGAGERLAVYVSGIIYILFWFNTFLYLVNNYSRKETIVFSSFCLLSVLICIFSTINVLKDHPLAARAMNGAAEGISDYDIVVFQRMGCGGYGFIYGCVFIGFALLCGFRSELVNKRQKMILIILHLLFVYLIVQSQFSTAFLLLIIYVTFIILTYSKWHLLSIILVCIFALALFISFQYILRGLSNIAYDIGAIVISDKLNMLNSSLGSRDVESLARTQKYMISINGFTSNPIAGSGISGGHSQILDTLSTIGMVGVVYVIFLLSIFKEMRIYIDEKYVTLFEIIVLLLAIFNPFVDSTLLSITYMLVPALLFSFAPKSTFYNRKGVATNEGTLGS